MNGQNDKNTAATPAGLEALLRDLDSRPALDLIREATEPGNSALLLELKTSGSTGLPVPVEIVPRDRLSVPAAFNEVESQAVPRESRLTIADVKLPPLDELPDGASAAAGTNVATAAGANVPSVGGPSCVGSDSGKCHCPGRRPLFPESGVFSGPGVATSDFADDLLGNSPTRDEGVSPLTEAMLRRIVIPPGQGAMEPGDEGGPGQANPFQSGEVPSLSEAVLDRFPPRGWHGFDGIFGTRPVAEPFDRFEVPPGGDNKAGAAGDSEPKKD